MIIQKKLNIKSQGFTHILDITESLKELLSEAKVQNGNILVFVPGSTAGLTTVEYEPGLLKDLPEMFEKLAPQNAQYHHDQTWHDGNGYAHVRSSLIGPSITIPVEKGQLVLGTWQQVVFIDFDNRPRHRNLHVQIFGE